MIDNLRLRRIDPRMAREESEWSLLRESLDSSLIEVTDFAGSRCLSGQFADCGGDALCIDAGEGEHFLWLAGAGQG